MKKILMTFIIMIALLLVGITTVQAAGFDVKITPETTTLKRGDTVKVMVSAENLDINPNRGLVTFEAVLDFDKNVFHELQQTKEVQNFKTQELWYLGGYTQDNGILGLAYNSGDYNREDTKIVEVTFTVKDNATLGNTMISLKNIKGTDGDVFINANSQNVSKAFTIADKTSGGNSGTGDGTGNGGNTQQPPAPVKPVITASQEKVANGMKVTLTSNIELKPLQDWELSTDKKKLTRVYTKDFKGSVVVESADGVKSDAINLDVKAGTSDGTGNNGNPGNNGNGSGTTQDKLAPTATVKQTTGTTGVTVTVTANEQIKTLTDWTLSADKKTLTRLFTKDFSGTITLEDLAGNKSVPIKIDVKVEQKNGTGTGSGNTSGNNAGSGSQSGDSLPKAGAAYVVPVIALVAIIGTGAFVRYKSMEY